MQAQTNPMNPQGLASLMKGMPQGQPNPAQPNPLQPQPASPGSISQIRDTYGTNTVPRDLKALLALNEALQMVESSKRQEQLQTPVPQGTIRDQMTQAAQGIMQQAQNVAQTSQQAEAQKQAMLQRMLGVAGAPGASQVMPPRMAMGGVVAFQNQGAVPMPVADQPQIRRTYGSAPDYEDARRFGISLSPYDSPEVRAEKLERLRKMREFEAEQQAKGRAEIPTEESQAAQEAIARAYADRSRQRDIPPRPAPPRPAAPGPARGIPTVPREQPVLPPTLGGGITMPGAPTPRRDVAPQLGAMEQGSALPMGMQRAPQEDPMKRILGQVNPEELRAAAEGRARGVYGMSDEEKRIYEEQIARMRQEAAPKDTRWYERLGELAARYAAQPVQGSNVGALGGIATVGAGLEKERLTEKQKRQAEIDALQEKFLGRQRTAREKTFETGEAAFGKGLEQQARIGAIGADVLGTQTRAGTEAAGLKSREEIEKANRESKEAVARLDREAQIRVAQIQSAVRAGGQITPDDRRAIRVSAARAVDDRLEKDLKFQSLRSKDPAEAERQRQAAINKEADAILRFARGEAPATGAAPTTSTAPRGTRENPIKLD